MRTSCTFTKMQTYSSVVSHPQLHTIILIDCGASVDLSDFISFHPELTVFIFDSHRPISLTNIFANDQVEVVLMTFVGCPNG